MQFISKILAVSLLLGGAFAAPTPVDNADVPVDVSVDVPADIANLTIPDTNVKPAGTATWYNAGLGSCGEVNDGKVEDVVALSQAFMPNNNYCGRTIRISHAGKTFRGRVVDTCPGCGRNDIDLSEHLFLRFAGLGVGRISVNWNLV